MANFANLKNKVNDMATTSEYVAIDKIKENEKNFYDTDYDIEELAESIKINGLLEPITINEDYVVVRGHRRLKASKLAGLSEIKCYIRSYSSSDDEELDLMVSNEYRIKNSVELAREYNRKLEIYKAKGIKKAVSKVQEDMNISKSQASRLNKINDMNEEEQKKVINNDIKISDLDNISINDNGDVIKKEKKKEEEFIVDNNQLSMFEEENIDLREVNDKLIFTKEDLQEIKDIIEKFNLAVKNKDCTELDFKWFVEDLNNLRIKVVKQSI